MDLHRRHLLGLFGPGLATLVAAADEEATAAARHAARDDFRDEDLTGAILTINLAAIQENWRILRSLAGGAECGAAVKANAYGLGMLPVCRALWMAGCRSFFVARPREGERLRGLLPDATIYVLDGLFAGEPEHFERFHLRPALISLAEARRWVEFSRTRDRRLPCGLHVDTGINRLGFSPSEFAALLDDRPTIEGLDVSLLMSHLACADDPAKPMNARQLTMFQELRRRLPGVPASLANSSGIFLGKDYAMDLVRPGLAIYGGNPTPGRPHPMRQVVSLEGVVMQVRDLAVGDVVGYGATWEARRPSRIALLGAGYKDGIPRSFSSGLADRAAAVAIDGVRCAIIGRISMDMMAVDVTDLPVGSVAQGTRAEILGRTISLDEAASWAETISYELLARLGGRFARVYEGLPEDG
jgi:alanine racemase